MNYNNRLKELYAEIDTIKTIQHNNGMKGASNVIGKRLKSEMTEAEKQFDKIAKLKHLKLIPQYKVNIIRGSRIVKFYFADFCDTKNKLIFEIDGEYHFTDDQIKKDLKRTRDLTRAGYKVYRITNEEVFNGGTTSFLVNIYRNLGIKI